MVGICRLTVTVQDCATDDLPLKITFDAIFFCATTSKVLSEIHLALTALPIHCFPPFRLVFLGGGGGNTVTRLLFWETI